MDMTSLVRHDRAAAEQPLLAADGTPRLPHVAYDDEGYPHSDGAPLAQNTLQAHQLIYAFSALEWFVHEHFPDAFAATDLLIYPRPHDLKASVAPDVFVAFGAGDKARLSYKLWEGEPVPAFVLEVLSGTTEDKDLGEKRGKYAAMGVGEYWVFDPFGRRIRARIAGYRLRGRRYRPIPPLPGTRVVPSDVLGLEFRAEATTCASMIRSPGRISKATARGRPTSEPRCAGPMPRRSGPMPRRIEPMPRRIERMHSRRRMRGSAGG